MITSAIGLKTAKINKDTAMINQAVAKTNRLALNREFEMTGTGHQGNSTTLLDYITEGMTLKSRSEKELCRVLYKYGMAQFDAESNNRYGAIEKAQEEMDNLRGGMSAEELDDAERLGIEKARFDIEKNIYPPDAKSSELSSALAKIHALSSTAQMYAAHKAAEESARLSIVRDMEKGIPITDYTHAKKLIAQQAPLRDVIEELPTLWQEIHHIPWPRAKTEAKPSKPKLCPGHHSHTG